MKPLLPLLRTLGRHCSSPAAPIDTAAKQTFGGMSQQTFTKLVEEMCPFVKNIMPLEVLNIAKGKLTVKLPFKPDYIGNALVPAMHGGVAASIIDHVGGFAAWSCIDSPQSMIATIDLRIDYLRPAPLEDLECEGKVIHFGPKKQLIRVDIALYSSKDKDRYKPIATGRGTWKSYFAKQLLDNADTVAAIVDGGTMQGAIDKLVEKAETK